VGNFLIEGGHIEDIAEKVFIIIGKFSSTHNILFRGLGRDNVNNKCERVKTF